VLAALTAGYFLGGIIADRTVSAAVLGMIVGLASIYLLALPAFADAILRLVLDAIDNVRLGSLCAARAIMFLPVMLLGVYSPFAISLCQWRPRQRTCEADDIRRTIPWPDSEVQPGY
jgi:hypothetical protein